MNIFNLIATLSLDNTEYEKKLEDSKKSSQSFASKLGTVFKTIGKGITAVVGVVSGATAALTKLTLASVSYGDVIKDNSIKLGITTESYQLLSYAFEQAGIQSEKLKDYVRRLTTFTQNLSTGNGDALIALEELGIGYEEFMAMGTDDQIKTITEAFQGLENGTDKVALAQKIFGNETYIDFMPILQQEAEALSDTEAKMKDLGLMMSGQAVDAADKLADEILALKSAIKVLSAGATSELYPAISGIVNGFTALITGSKDTDEALQDIKDSVSSLFSTVTKILPDLLTGAGVILLDLIDVLLDAITSSDFLLGLSEVISEIITKAIEILPSLISSLTRLVPSLIQALLNIDWADIILALIEALTQIMFVELPNMLMSIFELIVDLVTSGRIFQIIGKIGKAIGQGIVNAVITMFESGINFIIKGINKIIDSSVGWLRKIGINIGRISEITLPRVNLMADGGMFDDLLKNIGGKGTAYAIAGEGTAEIVAQGAKGTGVTNIKQFKEAMLEALKEYGFTELAEAIVNGIISGLTINATTDTDQRNITLKIGEKEFKTYVVQAANEILLQRGRKSLNQVTGY